MSKKKTSTPNQLRQSSATPTSGITFKERPFKFSDTQQEVLAALMSENLRVAFISGPAGSTKTFLAVYAALHLISQSPEKDILYVRTIIESASRSLGSLPGNVEEKLQPYLIPLEEKLEEIIPKNEISRLKRGRIAAIPVNFLRGSSLRNKIIIVDEAQNFTVKELLTVITRLGEGSKIFFCGDSCQSDIGAQSGFLTFFDRFDNEESEKMGIWGFEFDESDIKRSEILKFIVNKLYCSRL